MNWKTEPPKKYGEYIVLVEGVEYKDLYVPLIKGWVLHGELVEGWKDCVIILPEED